MKKGFLTVSLLLAVVLLTVGLYGCDTSNPADDGEQAAQAAPSEVKVTLNNQLEGIWVSGTGKVTVTPDIALLELGIEAQEVSVTEAQARASEAMEKVMSSLVDNGVAEKDIQTWNFRIRQRSRWDDEQQQEVAIGYRVTNDVVAKIRDIEKVSSIIDAVVAAGGDYTRIDDLNFSVDDPSAYYDEAREKAMTDARDKAEQIANLAGKRLGEPTYIAESGVTPYYNYGGMAYEMEMAAAAPTVIVETPISLGEVDIRVNLQVAYTIVE